ncbi:uncharacterized protein GGS25DRAFT_518625 [Hypoxylon fragiforme]|uniref:uncharacterized protein n=1 Tax=Hypoxylon fragiforme TaxID=63214 RepID=UPI0020C5DC7D|nr:uncharacterized protein GGS25DRAFT_518625 [Hypoxylon fragiforme]KAI2612936.1 hypothetical protein GGS25DRAFT_518625 [Hypoxylon fragiforme]
MALSVSFSFGSFTSQRRLGGTYSSRHFYTGYSTTPHRVTHTSQHAVTLIASSFLLNVPAFTKQQSTNVAGALAPLTYTLALRQPRSNKPTRDLPSTFLLLGRRSGKFLEQVNSIKLGRKTHEEIATRSSCGDHSTEWVVREDAWFSTMRTPIPPPPALPQRFCPPTGQRTTTLAVEPSAALKPQAGWMGSENRRRGQTTCLHWHHHGRAPETG